MKKVTELTALAVSAFLSGLIYIYRYSLASVFGGQCRFTPSCSAYALEAIAAHGPIKGSAFAAKRICRCHPWTVLGGKHGFDPVPPHVK